MHAKVVVNRSPYSMLPSPCSRIRVFLSVTSCRKLISQKANHQESVERVAVNLKKGIEPPQKKKCYLFLSLAKKVSGLWWMAQNGRKEMRDYLRAHTKSLGLEKKILTPKSCY